jgi:hypothetical protein
MGKPNQIKMISVTENDVADVVSIGKRSIVQHITKN